MNESSDSRLGTLRDFGLRLVSFLSRTAMDPHLYFEQKLSAEIRASRSADEMTEKLRQLIEWLDEIELPESQLRRFDAELEAAGLPSLAAMRAEDR